MLSTAAKNFPNPNHRKYGEQFAPALRALSQARGLNRIGGDALKELKSARKDEAHAEAEAERAATRLTTIEGAAAITGNRIMTVFAPATALLALVQRSLPAMPIPPRSFRRSVAAGGTEPMRRRRKPGMSG